MPTKRKHFELKECALPECSKLVPRIQSPYNYSLRKYCSKECSYLGRRNTEKRTCEQCGKQFGRTQLAGGARENSTSFKRRKFCSLKCFGAKNRADIPEDRVCVRCGKTIKRVKRLDPNTYRKRNYCNWKCRKKDYGHVRRCKHCNTMLRPNVRQNGYLESPAMFRRRKFCDYKCYNLWRDDKYEDKLFASIQKLARKKGWD